MSDSDLPDDDDLFAAEYALGSLDAADRAGAAARQVRDPGFAARVRAWEMRLAPLAEAFVEADPARDLWPAIAERLGPLRPAAADNRVIALDRAVSRWRRATVAVSALAACLAVALTVGALRDRRPAPTLIAVLEKTGDTPAYLMKADLATRSLTVKPLAAEPPPGHSYELWIIDPSLGAPRSLGVLGPDNATHPLPPLPPAVLSRAVYAVTEEPQGGSPNGIPSGQPVFTGRLIRDAF